MCLVAFLDSDPCLSVRLHGVCCMSLCLCVRPPCIDRMSVCLSVRIPKVCWVLVYLESVCLTDCITLSVFQSMYSMLYVWLPFCLSVSPHIGWGISVWLSVCLCVGLPVRRSALSLQSFIFLSSCYFLNIPCIQHSQPLKLSFSCIPAFVPV